MNIHEYENELNRFNWHTCQTQCFLAKMVPKIDFMMGIVRKPSIYQDNYNEIGRKSAVYLEMYVAMVMDYLLFKLNAHFECRNDLS